VEKVGTIDFPSAEPIAARDAVIRNSRALIEETYRFHPGLRPPPFDPMLFASVLGIPVFLEPTPEGLDAIYVPFRGRSGSSSTGRVLSLRRRRFSLAHEISHAWFEDPSGERYFLRTRDRRRYECDERLRVLEKCCDAGAAELLMPQPWFGEEMAGRGFRAAAVPALARSFDVSWEAAALRMVENSGPARAIGFFDYVTSAADAALAARGAGCVSSPAYRTRRIFKSGDFPFLFPPGKSVPSSSAIYRCSLGAEEIESVGNFELGPVSVRLRVSAFPLHRNGRITAPPAVAAVFRIE